MIEITTYLGCALLVALILFQIALILGAPFGNYAWGGQHRVLPTKLRIGSASSIVIYLLFMAFLVSKSGVWNIITHEPTLTIGMWAMTGYLFFGVLLNAISRSKQERMVMVPVALVLAICFLVGALV